MTNTLSRKKLMRTHDAEMLHERNNTSREQSPEEEGEGTRIFRTLSTAVAGSSLGGDTTDSTESATKSRLTTHLDEHDFFGTNKQAAEI